MSGKRPLKSQTPSIMVSEALVSLDEQLAILRTRTTACDVDLRCLLQQVRFYRQKLGMGWEFR